VPDLASNGLDSYRVWIAPGARRYCERMLREELADAEIVPLLEGADPVTGPATIVLHVDDLVGPHREDLMQLAERARPGRPIVLGNGKHKDVLLDAINVWQALQFLSPNSVTFSLVNAVHEAQRALCLELEVCDKIQELAKECQHLQISIPRW